MGHSSLLHDDSFLCSFTFKTIKFRKLFFFLKCGRDTAFTLLEQNSYRGSDILWRNMWD